MGGKMVLFEELMSQFEVAPEEIDTADIIKNGKIVLTIKPKGLWIIGVNGRIDLLSANGNNMVLDTAEQFKTPKWKLYSWDKKTSVDLTKQTFLQLLSSNF
jgi:outer membrane protease